jgi:DNA invertase Pin-like site-specific DNA recombinase
MKTQQIAYSYVRFSNPIQATGDSLRRQTEAARGWCGRNGYRLDESTTLRDLGASAYVGTHRSNPDRYALAGFLKLVEEGKVPRGSALVVESLDRLSREHIRPALSLVLNLIDAGIRLVQLTPVETIYDDRVEPMSLMMAIMELSRGHSESAVKSERVGKAFQEKKKKAREGDHLYTAQVPAWIRVTKTGEMELIPERAKVVKQIFDMSANGYGLTSIVGKLVADKVPAFGKTKLWKRSYVAAILKDRRALGEFQPKLRDKKTHSRIPDGKPIPDYFPGAVTANEYHAARAGADDRRNADLNATRKALHKASKKLVRGKTPITRRERSKTHTLHAAVNLFTGLIVSARNPNDRYHTVQRVDNRPGFERGRQWVLLNSASIEGAKCVSFPLVVFEKVIIGELQEIDPRTILGKDDGSPDEVLTLAGERSTKEQQIAKLESELLKGDVPSIARALRVLETERKELVAREAEARSRVVLPEAVAWGVAQPLLTALAKAPDQEDARRRLKAALRRIVKQITLLIVPRGRSRIAAVRIDFEGGKHRDYLITHTPPHYGYHGVAPARFEGGSEAWSDEAGELDLRKPEDVKILEGVLEKVDVTKLADTIAANNKKKASRLAKKRK